MDEKDAHLLVEHRWTIRRVTHPDEHSYETVAASKSVGPRGSAVRTLTYLHKLILGPNPPKSQPAWIDGNRLNCSRANLYFAPVGQHLQVHVGKTRYPCPFGADRLQELHWREVRTLQEIGILAQRLEGWPKAPSCEIVKRWLKTAGVRNRSLSEVITQRNAEALRTGTGMYSDQAKSLSAQKSRNRHAPILIGNRVIVLARRGWKHTSQSKKKMAAAQKAVPDRRDSRVTVICALEACAKEFKVFPSQKSERQYCCKQHSALAKRNHVEVQCTQCSTLLSRPKCRAERSVRHFCNKTCQARYHNKSKVYKSMTAATRAKIATANRARATGDWRKCSVPECPNAVYVQPYKLQKQDTFTCSRECQHELHRRRMQARFKSEISP